MTLEELEQHPAWKECTYEGAERAVLQAGARMTMVEKIRWLEDAETLSLRFKINRQRAIREGRLPPSKE
ncbi:MAG: hypothetical protein NTZ01_00580 [Verrucomicrobia bacterium]|nr:hypothetical protein [Verrucomicrobiota bacterium]